MKYPILYFVFIITFSANAQKRAIKFQENLSWVQIKEKAKRENKYIFLDCYTTWCVPCKEMSLNVFTQKEVGDFFNENFINAAAQFDVTKTDNHQIKSWYPDIKRIKKEYKISSYPSYLFFNPNGDLVYKILGKQSAMGFIEQAKNALNPKTQYPMLKAQYADGRRDTAFLVRLINVAANDGVRDIVPTYVNEYFSQHKEALTKQDFIYAYYGTQKTTDSGFRITQKYPKQMDSLFGDGYSKNTINRIIFNEFVFPDLRTNGKIENKGGGMFLISGDINKNINWEKSKSKVDATYPTLQAQVMRYSKTEYFQWLKDWEGYSNVVNRYVLEDGSDLDPDELTGYADRIFQFCDNKELLIGAIGWCNLAQNAKAGDQVKAKFVEACLQYKNGNKKVAILKMDELIKLNNRNVNYF